MRSVMFNPIPGDVVAWRGSHFKVIEVCQPDAWNGQQAVMTKRLYVNTVDKQPVVERIWMRAWHQMCREGDLIKRVEPWMPVRLFSSGTRSAVDLFAGICESIDNRLLASDGPAGSPGAFFREMTDSEASHLYECVQQIRREGR